MCILLDLRLYKLLFCLFKGCNIVLKFLNLVRLILIVPFKIPFPILYGYIYLCLRELSLSLQLFFFSSSCS